MVNDTYHCRRCLSTLFSPDKSSVLGPIDVFKLVESLRSPQMREIFINELEKYCLYTTLPTTTPGSSSVSVSVDTGSSGIAASVGGIGGVGSGLLIPKNSSGNLNNGTTMIIVRQPSYEMLADILRVYLRQANNAGELIQINHMYELSQKIGVNLCYSEVLAYKNGSSNGGGGGFGGDMDVSHTSRSVSGEGVGGHGVTSGGWGKSTSHSTSHSLLKRLSMGAVGSGRSVNSSSSSSSSNHSIQHHSISTALSPVAGGSSAPSLYNYHRHHEQPTVVSLLPTIIEHESWRNPLLWLDSVDRLIFADLKQISAMRLTGTVPVIESFFRMDIKSLLFFMLTNRIQTMSGLLARHEIVVGSHSSVEGAGITAAFLNGTKMLFHLPQWISRNDDGDGGISAMSLMSGGTGGLKLKLEFCLWLLDICVKFYITGAVVEDSANGGGCTNNYNSSSVTGGSTHSRDVNRHTGSYTVYSGNDVYSSGFSPVQSLLLVICKYLQRLQYSPELKDSDINAIDSDDGDSSSDVDVADGGCEFDSSRISGVGNGGETDGEIEIETDRTSFGSVGGLMRANTTGATITSGGAGASIGIEGVTGTWDSVASTPAAPAATKSTNASITGVTATPPGLTSGVVIDRAGADSGGGGKHRRCSSTSSIGNHNSSSSSGTRQADHHHIGYSPGSRLSINLSSVASFFGGHKRRDSGGSATTTASDLGGSISGAGAGVGVGSGSGMLDADLNSKFDLGPDVNTKRRQCMCCKRCMSTHKSSYTVNTTTNNNYKNNNSSASVDGSASGGIGSSGSSGGGGGGIAVNSGNAVCGGDGTTGTTGTTGTYITTAIPCTTWEAIGGTPASVISSVSGSEVKSTAATTTTAATTAAPAVSCSSASELSLKLNNYRVKYYPSIVCEYCFRLILLQSSATSAGMSDTGASDQVKVRVGVDVGAVSVNGNTNVDGDAATSDDNAATGLIGLSTVTCMGKCVIPRPATECIHYIEECNNNNNNNSINSTNNSNNNNTTTNASTTAAAVALATAGVGSSADDITASSSSSSSSNSNISRFDQHVNNNGNDHLHKNNNSNDDVDENHSSALGDYCFIEDENSPVHSLLSLYNISNNNSNNNNNSDHPHTHHGNNSSSCSGGNSSGNSTSGNSPSLLVNEEGIASCIDTVLDNYQIVISNTPFMSEYSVKSTSFYSQQLDDDDNSEEDSSGEDEDEFCYGSSSNSIGSEEEEEVCDSAASDSGGSSSRHHYYADTVVAEEEEEQAIGYDDAIDSDNNISDLLVYRQQVQEQQEQEQEQEQEPINVAVRASVSAADPDSNMKKETKGVGGGGGRGEGGRREVDETAAELEVKDVKDAELKDVELKEVLIRYTSSSDKHDADADDDDDDADDESDCKRAAGSQSKKSSKQSLRDSSDSNSNSSSGDGDDVRAHESGVRPLSATAAAVVKTKSDVASGITNNKRDSAPAAVTSTSAATANSSSSINISIPNNNISNIDNGNGPVAMRRRRRRQLSPALEVFKDQLKSTGMPTMKVCGQDLTNLKPRQLYIDANLEYLYWADKSNSRSRLTLSFLRSYSSSRKNKEDHYIDSNSNSNNNDNTINNHTHNHSNSSSSASSSSSSASSSGNGLSTPSIVANHDHALLLSEIVSLKEGHGDYASYISINTRNIDRKCLILRVTDPKEYSLLLKLLFTLIQ